MSDDFTDRLAATTLAEEAMEAGPGTAIPVATVVRDAMEHGEAGPRVVPLGAVPLYRALRTAGSRLSSPAALAASTGTEQARVVGDVTIRTLDEGDVLWLMIDLGSGPLRALAPQRLELLGPGGRIMCVDLDAPIDGVIQMGFRRADGPGRDMIPLLEDPATSIFLM